MNLPLVTTNPSSLTEWRSTPLLLPTMYDLPSEDPEEPGLPDIFHGLQPQLLDETLYLPQYADDRAEMIAAQAEVAAAIARLNAAQQESKQQQTRSILKMLNMGLAIEQVADVLGVTIEAVRSVREGMDDR